MQKANSERLRGNSWSEAGGGGADTSGCEL